MNRIGIFAMYDEDGIVDDYRIYLIKEIRAVVSRLIIVVNGDLRRESIAQIKDYTQEIVLREDKGYDCTAIKEILQDYIGWDQIKEYDELVWANDSVFGPFVSFHAMIENMKSSDGDFWGITEQESVVNTFPVQKYDKKYLPHHIQPYVLFVRGNLLHSNDFIAFWETMPLINDYVDAIVHYELRFTQFFEERGYVGEAYVKNLVGDAKEPEKNDIWIMNHPFSMISQNNLPLIKKKCFSRNHDDLLGYSVGEDAYQILDYLTENTDYPVDYIWKYLIRVMNPADLNRTLKLKYVLSVSASAHHWDCKKKAAVIAHVNYDDLVEESFDYLKNVPEEIDIFINTKKNSTRDKIHQCIEHYNMKNCQVIMIGERGREIRGLLIESKEVFRKYEYICFVHDKKTTGNLINPLLGQKYMELLWENTLKSKDYIYNCLSLLEENKCLGVLVPPPPYHDNNLGGISDYWANNYKTTKALTKRLRIKCKMEENVSPLTLGTTFWCRTDALRPLSEHPFREEDFPEEPVAMDGTLNHAIERVFSFVAQSQGYATGTIMNEEFSALYLKTYQNLLYSFLMELTNKHGRLALSDVYHIPNDLWQLVETREKLFVYGVGKNAGIMIGILEEMNLVIAGCIVSDGHKDKDFFCGYKVYELSELELNPIAMGIVVAVYDHNAIIEGLNERGMYAYCLMKM